MTPDYVVVWNGTHHGGDEDLLCSDRVPEKVYAAPPVRVDGPTNAERVAAVLSTAPSCALRLHEIARAANLSKQQANDGLYVLRRQGRLVSVAIGPPSTNPRPPQRYSLKATPSEAL